MLGPVVRSRSTEPNRLRSQDSAAHEWYRFVLSFPPHLVQEYVVRFGLTERSLVLDPFCGTGTTPVECKKLGIPSVGIEANPMAQFAARVKVNWSVDDEALSDHAHAVARRAYEDLASQGIVDAAVNGHAGPDGMPLRTLAPQSMGLLLTDSIRPLALHKALVLLDVIDLQLRDDRMVEHERLAFAKAIVASVSNLHFGPEVGVDPRKLSAPVVPSWLTEIRAMVSDLRKLQPHRDVASTIIHADARDLVSVLEPRSVDAVITSPPYPNEKDYTRTTRLESVLLGFVRDRVQLRELKQSLIRSNTRSVYKADDDDRWVAQFPGIQEIAAQIEARRLELGKTSGFERLYARVTKLYFGGMARHLEDLRTVLRPGAQLAYVVGDQASYLRVMIRTGQILGEIATSLGYELVGIDLWRTRIATATREQLREEVVLLRWPGYPPSLAGLMEETPATGNRGTQIYVPVIEKVFFDHFREGESRFPFMREEIGTAADELGIPRPKNFGDVLYAFRFRRALPPRILATAPEGQPWVIRLSGIGRYRFEATPLANIVPTGGKAITKVPDATPSIILQRKLNDEQALLAMLRYNRLVDIFTGVTCYSLQNHLRTQTAGLGQTETDEVYLGVDKHGIQYVFPVEAKAGSDKLSIVQVEQDYFMCRDKWPGLVCRPIAAQFMNDGGIAIFDFLESDGELFIDNERHYRLVPAREISEEELATYRQRLAAE